ncbi:VRR-NUC domain-containing protein [Microvirga sesbaniae]|uniref:VRR-NUC domain-containing protein n=1 Tax=Microvirga sesbaniae TaxID=681392 RepID=UPI00358DC758
MTRQRSLPLFPSRGKPQAYRQPKVPAPKESVLHRAVADHLRTFAHPDWRWSHFPAGEKRDPRTAAKLKAMGVQKGWPDFILFGPGGRLHALELKRRGGVMTDEQKSFAAWCQSQGVPFACLDDLRDVLVALSNWGALKNPLTCFSSPSYDRVLNPACINGRRG